MPLSGAAILLGAGRPVVTRCVKLNNYWCIKRARWTGQIGHDEEGHVGFATAERGADAAVALLRRYYLDYGRRSALDIVRRWAPAECRTVAPAMGAPAAGGPAVRGPLSGGTATGVAAVLPTLAVRGIAGTLRARWLASRRAPALAVRAPRAQPRPAVAQRSTGQAAPSRPAPEVAAPARPEGAGVGRPQPSAAPIRTAARPTLGPATQRSGQAGPAVAPAPSASKPAGPATAAAAPRRHPVPPRAAKRAPATQVSAIPLRPLPAFRVPDIAAGMGERKPAAVSVVLPPRPAPAPIAAPAAQPRPAASSPAPRPALAASGATAVRRTPTVAGPPARVAAAAPAIPVRPAALPTRLAAAPAAAPAQPAPARSAPAALPRVQPASAQPAPAQPTAPPPPAAAAPAPRPVLVCGDEERIRNYAGRIVQGLDLGPTDDLQLFEPNGTPRPNLARVLVSMSAVELGHLRAGVDLIAEAVERATAKAADAAALAGHREFTP